MNFLSLFFDSVRKNRSLYSRLGDFISISIVPTIVSLSFLYIYWYKVGGKQRGRNRGRVGNTEEKKLRGGRRAVTATTCRNYHNFIISSFQGSFPPVSTLPGHTLATTSSVASVSSLIFIHLGKACDPSVHASNNIIPHRNRIPNSCNEYTRESFVRNLK